MSDRTDFHIMKVKGLQYPGYTAGQKLFSEFFSESTFRPNWNGSILQITIAVSQTSGATIISSCKDPATLDVQNPLNFGNPIPNTALGIFEFAGSNATDWDVVLSHDCTIDHVVIKELLK